MGLWVLTAACAGQLGLFSTGLGTTSRAVATLTGVLVDIMPHARLGGWSDHAGLADRVRRSAQFTGPLAVWLAFEWRRRGTSARHHAGDSSCVPTDVAGFSSVGRGEHGAVLHQVGLPVCRVHQDTSRWQASDNSM